MGLPFDMSDESPSVAMQLIREAAAASKAAEGAAVEARHEVALLKEEVRRMGRLVDKHEALIDGNGTAGIREKLSHAKRTADGNREWLARHEKVLAKQRGYLWDFAKTVLSAAIGAGAVLLAGFLT